MKCKERKIWFFNTTSVNKKGHLKCFVLKFYDNVFECPCIINELCMNSLSVDDVKYCNFKKLFKKLSAL